MLAATPCVGQADWAQVPQVLAWFCGPVVAAAPHARLAFAACLPKEQRAEVHTYV
jgi:hypothetical protein